MDYQQLLGKYTRMTKTVKDALAENLAVSTIMTKQISLYDTDITYDEEDDKLAFKNLQPFFESSFDKNSDTYRTFNEQYETHLFCVNNKYEDVREAVKTVDRFYDYKVECLDRVKALVR